MKMRRTTKKRPRARVERRLEGRPMIGVKEIESLLRDKQVWKNLAVIKRLREL